MPVVDPPYFSVEIIERDVVRDRATAGPRALRLGEQETPLGRMALTVPPILDMLVEVDGTRYRVVEVLARSIATHGLLSATTLHVVPADLAHGLVR